MADNPRHIPEECPACGKRVHVHRGIIDIWACEDPECGCSHTWILEQVGMLSDRLVFGTSVELDGRRLNPLHIKLHQDGTYERQEYVPIKVDLEMSKEWPRGSDSPFSRNQQKKQLDFHPDPTNWSTGYGKLIARGVHPTRIRTPEGNINNCYLSGGYSDDSECPICEGACPDRKRFSSES